MQLYPRLDKDRPGVAAAVGGGRPGSNLPAFARGLVIGFVSAFVVLDWALLGGATAQAAAHWLGSALFGI